MAAETLPDVLQKALEMEKKGFDFYKKVSAQSENAITKKTFASLADYEAVHIENIKNFYNSLKESSDFPEVDFTALLNERKEAGELFLEKISSLKEKIKPDDDDKKACEFAMELENSGHRYYENMLKEARDQNLVKLLEFLLEEESLHYEWIANLHSYLTDSANWYMYEEGSFPQG